MKQPDTIRQAWDALNTIWESAELQHDREAMSRIHRAMAIIATPTDGAVVTVDGMPIVEYANGIFDAYADGELFNDD